MGDFAHSYHNLKSLCKTLQLYNEVQTSTIFFAALKPNLKTHTHTQTRSNYWIKYGWKSHIALIFLELKYFIVLGKTAILVNMKHQYSFTNIKIWIVLMNISCIIFKY